MIRLITYNPPESALLLAPGYRVGPYEIRSTLGVGGMGEVHRAHDVRLQRDVALKLLPEPFASDPDRLARFRREALVLASLSHANIAAIHGIEEDAASRVHALVLELVDGPTLADRIASGRIPLDELRAVARQIIEALHAAHERGVIHRDLKPSNIKIRDDGTVKVLDFGLAKMLDTASPVERPLRRRSRARLPPGWASFSEQPRTWLPNRPEVRLPICEPTSGPSALSSTRC